MEISVEWGRSENSPHGVVRIICKEWSTWLSKNPASPTAMFLSYFYIKYKILVTIKNDRVIFNGSADRFLILDLIDQ